MTVRMDVVAVIPYGSGTAQTHLKFDSDYKTFCGRVCEDWEPSETELGAVLNSAYTCKRCMRAFYK